MRWWLRIAGISFSVSGIIAGLAVHLVFGGISEAAVWIVCGGLAGLGVLLLLASTLLARS